MLFKNYFILNESTASEGAAISHLDHIEDFILIYGMGAYSRFVSDVKRIVDFLKKEKSDIAISEKFDGCVHPQTLIKTTEGNIPIIDIINSNKSYQCYTYNEKTDVVEIQDIFLPRTNHNEKNWVEIELENGESVKCTEDHEWFTTNRGWVKAKELTEEDDILELKQ
jgi:hypothetical protein